MAACTPMKTISAAQNVILYSVWISSVFPVWGAMCEYGCTTSEPQPERRTTTPASASIGTSRDQRWRLRDVDVSASWRGPNLIILAPYIPMPTSHQHSLCHGEARSLNDCAQH